MGVRDSAIAALVAVIWGSNFVVIDAGLHGIPPLLFVAMRFVLVCLPAVFVVGRPPAPWRTVVLVGMFMSLGQFALVYLALHLGMPAGLTSLVLQVQVLFTVALSSLALREHPSRWQLAGVAVGVVGLVVVGMGRSAVAPILPFVLVLGGALSWAAGNIVSRRARVRSGLSLVVWSALVVPLPMLALSLVVDGPPAVGHALAHLSLAAVLSTLFTAWFASLFGYGAWNTLLARHPATSVVPFTMLVPVAGILAAWVFLGEVPSPTELAGGALLLTGVAATLVRRTRSPLLPAREGCATALQEPVTTSAD